MAGPPRLSLERVEEYTRRFESVKISVLGDVMLDRYFWGDVDRISPEAPVPIVRVRDKSARLGGAANVASNLRALGASVRLSGTLGDDREAAEVKTLLDRHGISADGMIELRDHETTKKVRIIARNQQVVRADFEMNGDLPAAARDRIFESLRAQSTESDALLVSDYGKGVLQEEYLRELVSIWKANGKPILVDPHVGHFSWYRGATIMTPNVKEAATGAALRPGAREVSDADAFRIRSDLELEALLVTRGEHGMSLYFGDRGEARKVHVPTTAKEVYDVTGAGDTVIGVLAAALASRVDLVDAVVLANQAAGEVIKEVGTSAVTRDDLINAFK